MSNTPKLWTTLNEILQYEHCGQEPDDDGELSGFLLHTDCPQFGRQEIASKFNECKYALENQRLGWLRKLWRSFIGQKNLEENNG